MGDFEKKFPASACHALQIEKILHCCKKKKTLQSYFIIKIYLQNPSEPGEKKYPAQQVTRKKDWLEITHPSPQILNGQPVGEGKHILSKHSKIKKAISMSKASE